MQEATKLGDKKINDDLLANIFGSERRYWSVCGFLAMGVGAFALAAGYMIVTGLGVTGLNRPVFWGFFITNFVFWVGISHAGVMLSAILRLTKAEWRRPATRAAEIVTVFSLFTALMMPVIHTGRPWRIIYWFLPYDFQRMIWPNIRSALVWDPTAINTYLTCSILFVFVALIPDLAVIRDRSTGIRRLIYSGLSLGWRGTSQQWKLQMMAGVLLSALILPIFVSVHSIVSFDFSMAISVKGWHTTIFAPYFVIGAVHSGVSAVVTVLILLRFLFRWEDYIKPDHLDALGKLLAVVGTAWFFFFALEFLYGIYGAEPDEIALRTTQLFSMPWGAMFIAFLITGYFFPVPMWLFRSVRRSMLWMTITTISVNIGMWLERFLIIVPGLMRKQDLSFVWNVYSPSIVEITIVLGTFCLVLLGVLLFAKAFPLIPLYDIKEGEVLQGEVTVGRAKVPAAFHEE